MRQVGILFTVCSLIFVASAGQARAGVMAEGEAFLSVRLDEVVGASQSSWMRTTLTRQSLMKFFGQGDSCQLAGNFSIEVAANFMALLSFSADVEVAAASELPPQIVPEPSSLAIFGMGCIGARRKQIQPGTRYLS